MNKSANEKVAHAEFLKALADTTWLVTAVKNGAADRAPWLLNVLAKKIRQGEQLQTHEADYLAGSLEAAMVLPTKAAHAFGLIRPSNRPQSRGTNRNFEIFRRVQALNRSGLSIDDNRKRLGACSVAAQQFHVSKATAKRAYDHWVKWDRQMECMLAQAFAEHERK